MLVGASGNLVGVEVPPWRGGDGKAVAPEVDKCLEYADGTSRQCSPSGSLSLHFFPSAHFQLFTSLTLEDGIGLPRRCGKLVHCFRLLCLDALSSCSLGFAVIVCQNSLIEFGS